MLDPIAPGSTTNMYDAPRTTRTTLLKHSPPLIAAIAPPRHRIKGVVNGMSNVLWIVHHAVTTPMTSPAPPAKTLLSSKLQRTTPRHDAEPHAYDATNDGPVVSVGETASITALVKHRHINPASPMCFPNVAYDAATVP